MAKTKKKVYVETSVVSNLTARRSSRVADALMQITTEFYSETLDDLYKVKDDIANEYNSLTEFCIHLKDVESMMRANGATFLSHATHPSFANGTTAGAAAH